MYLDVMYLTTYRCIVKITIKIRTNGRKMGFGKCNHSNKLDRETSPTSVLDYGLWTTMDSAGKPNKSRYRGRLYRDDEIYDC